MIKNLARILSLVAALIFGVTPAPAWFTGGGELQGFWIGSTATPPTVTYVTRAASATDANSHTFNTTSTGTAGATRKTIVGVCGVDDAVDFEVTGVTVGGVAATEVANAHDLASTFSQTSCAIYIIDNPSGTTANIVVSWTEVIITCYIAVWAAYDLSSSTPTDIAGAFSTNSSSITGSVDVSALGIAVGVCNSQTSAQTTTWTGLTERDDATAGDGSASAADFTNDASADAPLSITCDYTGTGDSTVTTASFL